MRSSRFAFFASAIEVTAAIAASLLRFKFPLKTSSAYTVNCEWGLHGRNYFQLGALVTVSVRRI